MLEIISEKTVAIKVCLEAQHLPNLKASAYKLPSNCKGEKRPLK